MAQRWNGSAWTARAKGEKDNVGEAEGVRVASVRIIANQSVILKFLVTPDLIRGPERQTVTLARDTRRQPP